MPNDNDNKLVTLADLAEAYNALYARDVMDASDKTKLDGIEAGAQVNTVTSVNSQTGAVSITPANIGAVAKTGGTMTGPLTMNSSLFGALGSTGFRIDDDGALSYLCTDLDFYGSGGGRSHYIICNFGNGETFYNYVLRLPFWDSPKYKRQMGGTSAQTPWYDFLTSEKTVTVSQGGTGATTPAGARNNLGIYPFHINVSVDSNGKGYINFSSIGLSSRPNVCFMEIVNAPLTSIYYDYNSSTSQIVFIAYWLNESPITNTTVELQGVAFA